MTNSSRFFYMKGLGGWLGVKGVAWGPSEFPFRK